MLHFGDPYVAGEHPETFQMLWFYTLAAMVRHPLMGQPGAHAGAAPQNPQERVAEMLALIDRIDNRYVGAVNVMKLRAHAPAVLRRFFDFFVPDRDVPRLGAAWSEPWVTVDNAEIERRLAIRALRTSDMCNAVTSQLLAELAKHENGGLYERQPGTIKRGATLLDAGRRQMRSAATPVELRRAPAGFFTVPKSDSKLRTICDARAGNLLMETRKFPFVIFGLNTLLHTMDRVYDIARSGSGRGAVYVLSGDQRHWFWQLPLPHRYRDAFAMNMADERSYFRPVAWPMGASISPALAQAVTLSFLLASERPGEPLERLAAIFDIDYDALDSFNDTMPPWIPFLHGGGIFVIMDNFFVVTPRKDVRNAWAKRVVRAVSPDRGFNVTLKVQEQIINGHSEKHELLLYDVGPNTPPAEWPVFLGIAFGYGKRFVPVKKDKGKPLPGLSTTCTTSTSAAAASAAAPTARKVSWSGSHRELAGVLGTILWHQRVTQPYMCRKENEKLINIFSKAAPRAGRESVDYEEEGENKVCSMWDRSAADVLDEADVILLKLLWQQRNDEVQVSAQELRPINQISFVAVDASLSDAHRGIGIVYFGKSARAFEAEALVHRESSIALAELRAIIVGVNGAIEHDRDADLIIVASDNLNAIAWVEKMFARSAEANVMLRWLIQLLGDKRLFLTYVRSEMNAADQPSRQGKERVDDARAAATFARLQSALKEAMCIWGSSGGLTGADRSGVTTAAAAGAAASSGASLSAASAASSSSLLAVRRDRE